MAPPVSSVPSPCSGGLIMKTEMHCRHCCKHPHTHTHTNGNRGFISVSWSEWKRWHWPPNLPLLPEEGDKKGDSEIEKGAFWRPFSQDRHILVGFHCGYDDQSSQLWRGHSLISFVVQKKDFYWWLDGWFHPNRLDLFIWLTRSINGFTQHDFTAQPDVNLSC